VRVSQAARSALQRIDLLDLLDHLGADRDIGRRRYSQDTQGLEIDRQLEIGGLHDRQLGGLRAFEDAAA